MIKDAEIRVIGPCKAPGCCGQFLELHGAGGRVYRWCTVCDQVEYLEEMKSRLARAHQANWKLLTYLARSAGYDDEIGYIEELMDEAAQNGRPAQTLADLIQREARRLQAYWGETLDSGVTALGRPVTDENRARFQRWHGEITSLLGDDGR